MKNEHLEILSLFTNRTSLGKFRELHDCIELNKVVRFEVLLSDKSSITELLKQLSISFSWGNKIFKPIIDKGMETWSSSLKPCSPKDNMAMTFVYINEDIEKCMAANNLDNNNDDYALGVLLGYPKCCIDAYSNWLTLDNLFDPISIITKPNTVSTRVEAMSFPNPFTRYIGSGLFSHFPCSLSCVLTKDIAEKSLVALRNNFPDIADKIASFEKSLVLFEQGQGICFWLQHNSHNDQVLVNRNTLYGQGKFYNLCQTIDKIEITKSTLNLYSSSKVVNQLSLENLFLNSFN